MVQDVIWKVGGAQGEGIDSTGEILVSTLNHMGYFVFAYRHFMSLIKGGHTSYKVRIAREPVHYHGDRLDVLIAFDQRTIDENARELRENAVVLHDSKFTPAYPTGTKRVQTIAVPMSDAAKDLGNVIIKNMVAVGASIHVLGLDPEAFYAVIEEKFRKKGDAIVQKNCEAIRRGYDFCRDHFSADTCRLMPAAHAERPHLLLSGNEAVGLGALLAGCRLLAAYPITPATEILYWLLANLPKEGGKIIQAEDEIAACIMAIGANYTGVRAMTSTSGPGLSLMMEALGLAGISETPLVIVDVQRGGPGTGLPTKTEQSDLNEVLYGSHGEIPRIVLAPVSVADCFYDMIDAFNLAERYQCPVIVASDLYLGMSNESIAALDLSRVTIDRGELVTQEKLNALAEGEYHRYAVTESGVSPRAYPSQRNGRFAALSNEHEETGLEIEDPETRIAQMDKRFRKLQTLDVNNERGARYEGPQNARTVIVGFGSTSAQIREACEMLRSTNDSLGHLQIHFLSPFPDAWTMQHLQSASDIVVIENNKTGQLEGLIKQHVGLHDRIRSVRKYDGNPFTVAEIIQAVERVPVMM